MGAYLVPGWIIRVSETEAMAMAAPLRTAASRGTHWGCRAHRILAEQGRSADYQNLCQAFPTTPATSTTGEQVACVNDPFRYAGRERGDFCQDDNPCTRDFCDSPEGTCRYAPLSGLQEDCSGVVQRGCGQLTCIEGICSAIAHTPDESDPADCHSWAPLANGGQWFSSCFRNECNARHECVQTPVPAECDDGQFCDGQETCSLDHMITSRIGVLSQGIVN